MTQPLDLPTSTATLHIFSYKYPTCEKNKLILNPKSICFNKAHASLHEASNHNTATKKQQLLFEVNWENQVFFQAKINEKENLKTK